MDNLKVNIGSKFSLLHIKIYFMSSFFPRITSYHIIHIIDWDSLIYMISFFTTTFNDSFNAYYNEPVHPSMRTNYISNIYIPNFLDSL